MLPPRQQAFDTDLAYENRRAVLLEAAAGAISLNVSGSPPT
jgi:hypothetical protein